MLVIQWVLRPTANVIFMRHTEEMMWRWRQRLELCGYKPGNAKNGWQPPGAAERHGMKGYPVLPTLQFWTSSLQNYERINFFFLNLFFIEGWLLYRILLFSVKPQHESAIGIHISPPFWTSLPSPSPSHPSRLIQSPCLSFLSHTTNSYWLSILHMVM